MAQSDRDLFHGQGARLAQYDSDLSDGEQEHARSDSSLSDSHANSADERDFLGLKDNLTAYGERLPDGNDIIVSIVAPRNAVPRHAGCSKCDEKAKSSVQLVKPEYGQELSEAITNLATQTKHGDVTADSTDIGGTSLAMGDGCTMTPNCGAGPMGLRPETVTQLGSQGHDLAEAVIQPVVHDNHFYNQWARLPRVDEPEGEWPPGNRRSAAQRMLAGNGSLKTWNLLNAIARERGGGWDQQVGSSAAAFRSGCATLTKPSLSLSDASPQLSPKVGRRTVVETDSWQPRETTRSAEPGMCRQNSLPPLDDPRAATACGIATGGEPEVKDGFVDKDLPKDAIDCFFRGIPVTFLNSRTWSRRSQRGDRQSLGGGGHTESGGSGQRAEATPTPQQERFPMNTASLLFTRETDLRSQPSHYALTKSHHQHQQQHNRKDARDVAADKPSPSPSRAKPKASPSPGKQPEVTCVQFIDLTEVKTVVVADKGDITGGSRSKLNAQNKVNNCFVSKYGGGFCHFGRRIRGKLLSKPFFPIVLPLKIESFKVNRE